MDNILTSAVNAEPVAYRVVRVDDLGNFKANVLRPTTLSAAQGYVSTKKSKVLRVVGVYAQPTV